MKLKSMKLLNWRELSRQLGYNPNAIRTNKIPKHIVNEIKELLNTLDLFVVNNHRSIKEYERENKIE
jgi:hypothetical protein